MFPRVQSRRNLPLAVLLLSAHDSGSGRSLPHGFAGIERDRTPRFRDTVRKMKTKHN
jgi:hypothetical protein